MHVIKHSEGVEFEGNVAVECCIAALAFEKRKGRKVKYVNLCASWWLLFVMHMMSITPEADITPDGCIFNDAHIRRGPKNMNEKLEIEYEQPQ